MEDSLQSRRLPFSNNLHVCCLDNVIKECFCHACRPASCEQPLGADSCEESDMEHISEPDPPGQKLRGGGGTALPMPSNPMKVAATPPPAESPRASNSGAWSPQPGLMKSYACWWQAGRWCPSAAALSSGVQHSLGSLAWTDCTAAVLRQCHRQLLLCRSEQPGRGAARP